MMFSKFTVSFGEKFEKIVNLFRGDKNCDKPFTNSDQEHLDEAAEGPAIKRRKICGTQLGSVGVSMAKRGRPFEQRYYYQEAGKSERAALQPAMSNIASGDSSEAAGVQQPLFSGASRFVGGRVRNVCVSSSATAHSSTMEHDILTHSPLFDNLWSTSRPLRRPALAEPYSSFTSACRMNSKPRTGTPRVGRIDRLSQMKQRRLLAHECIKLDEKEIYKQMISQLSSDTSTVTPAAVSSTVSFRPRRDRINNVESSRRGNSTRRNHNESVDCIIVLDESTADPMKKRLDASSSLLSSFVDSGNNRSSYGSRQPTLLNDWSTPALSEVPGHVPPTTSGHASTSSQLTRPAMWSIQSHSRADTRCVAARPPASQRSRTDTDTRHHLNSVSVVRTSPPLADRRADTRTPELSADAVNDVGTDKLRQYGTVRSPVISDWEKSLRESKYAQDDFLIDLTREKETSERRHQLKARETAVQFYREKRLESEDQLVTRIRNSLTLSGRLPVPVEEPLCVLSESESDESTAEAEEEEELPELTDEQQSVVNRALNGPPDQLLVEGFKLQICRRDIKTLDGLNWLNDEVINFYMNLLMERGGKNSMPKVYSFSTFFYPKLLSGGHQGVRRWTKQVDLFQYDFILVPVHLGMHWCLAVVDFRRQEIRYYDSMGSNNEKCLNALMDYLGRESQAKRQTVMSFDGWQFFAVKDIPQQMNGSDCGMFACKFAEYVTRDARIAFCQEHMPYFRRRMIYEIVSKHLL